MISFEFRAIINVHCRFSRANMIHKELTIHSFNLCKSPPPFFKLLQEAARTLVCANYSKSCELTHDCLVEVSSSEILLFSSRRYYSFHSVASVQIYIASYNTKCIYTFVTIIKTIIKRESLGCWLDLSTMSSQKGQSIAK